MKKSREKRNETKEGRVITAGLIALVTGGPRQPYAEWHCLSVTWIRAIHSDISEGGRDKYLHRFQILLSSMIFSTCNLSEAAVLNNNVGVVMVCPSRTVLTKIEWI